MSITGFYLHHKDVQKLAKALNQLPEYQYEIIMDIHSHTVKALKITHPDRPHLNIIVRFPRIIGKTKIYWAQRIRQEFALRHELQLRKCLTLLSHYPIENHEAHDWHK